MAKRGAQGAGTIRQRKDGRWEARYTVGKDPGTGKQVQRSVYGETQKEVRQKLQRACTAIDDGAYLEPAKMTLGQWLDVWEREYIGDVKPFTVRSYSDQIRNHIKPALGAVKLSALASPDIQKFYNGLQRGTEGKGGLSPKTIKNIHGVLHRALVQAVELGYLRYNPADACKLPRVTRKAIKPLESGEIAAFLNAIQGRPFEAIFKIDLFTGMRQGEILGLTWGCLDFERGTILIEKQLQREKKKGGAYLLEPLKNDKSRVITPAPTVMQELRQQRTRQRIQRLAAGETWDTGGFPDLVFTNETGGHLVHHRVYRHFKQLAAQIGLSDARFHDLRHSYAVAALQSGDDIKTVQETLGHHTAAFTLDVYGHVSEKMKQDSANRMEQFIKSVEKGSK